MNHKNFLFAFICLLLLPINSFSQKSDTEFLISVIEKNVYSQLLDETSEQEKEYINGKVFYKDDNLNKYLIFVETLCKKYINKKDCPNLYYTTNNIVAAMYPNGTLVMNKEKMTLLNDNEYQFILAHEFAHWYYEHSKLRAKEIAKSVVNNGIFVSDVEKLLGVAFLLPGMSDVHKGFEKQADNFAFEYLKENNISINCKEMFKKLVKEDKISEDKHDSVDIRCSLI